MIRNLILDWSGTLVDDLPAVWRSTNHVFRMAGLEELTLERFRAEFCLPFDRFYQRFTPHMALPQLEEWFHGHHRQAQEFVVELPHACAFLEYARGRGLRMFVLSTVHPDHFASQAAATGFAAFMERAYVQVLDKRKKIAELLEENHLRREETLFIGDMQHDIETAKHGGVFSCAVLTGYNRLEQLRAAEPDLIVEHLGELQALFERTDGNLAGSFAKSGRARIDWRPIVTVGALIFNSRGEALLVRTHKWSDLWGIPGGKIEYAEPAAEALRREIAEETELRARDIQFEMVQECIRSNEFYREAHFVLLNYTCACEEPAEVRLNSEGQEFRWARLEEALALPLNQPTRRLICHLLEKRSRAAPADRTLAHAG